MFCFNICIHTIICEKLHLVYNLYVRKGCRFPALMVKPEKDIYSSLTNRGPPAEHLNIEDFRSSIGYTVRFVSYDKTGKELAFKIGFFFERPHVFRKAPFFLSID